MEAESQATNVRYQNNYVLPSESFLWLLMTTAISASRDPLDFFVLQLQAIITQLQAFSALSKEYVVYRYDKKSFLLFATRLWNEGCDSRRPISHVIDSLPTEIKEKRAMKYRRWTHSRTLINQTCNVKAHPQDEQLFDGNRLINHQKFYFHFYPSRLTFLFRSLARVLLNFLRRVLTLAYLVEKLYLSG